jgi:hypothetical protein
MRTFVQNVIHKTHQTLISSFTDIAVLHAAQLNIMDVCLKVLPARWNNLKVVSSERCLLKREARRFSENFTHHSMKAL